MLSSIFPRALPLPAMSGAASLLVLASGLSACGSSGPQFAPACPQTGFLRDAADLTSFRGAGTDITDIVLDGRITGGKLTCSTLDPDNLRAVLTVEMELARGPAMQGRSADVTYQVSASRGDTILNVQQFPVHVTFDRNTNRVRLTGEQVELILPIPGKMTGDDYRVFIGFQLTPEELAFNRRRGTR